MPDGTVKRGATVPTVYRLVWVAVMLAVVSMASAPPAWAHNCSLFGDLRPGVAGSFSLGVPAEQATVTGVEVRIPAGFEFAGVDVPPGWESRVEAPRLVLSGGRIAPFTCGYFEVHGVAPEKGTLLFPYTVRFADGSTREYANPEMSALDAAQTVFVDDQVAQTAPTTTVADRAGARAGRGASVVGGLVVVGVVVLLLRVRHRARAADKRLKR